MNDTNHASYTQTDSESVAECLIRAVAAFTNQEPDEIGPLYHTVDVDALDALFQARADVTPRGPGSLTFTVADCDVTV